MSLNYRLQVWQLHRIYFVGFVYYPLGNLGNTLTHVTSQVAVQQSYGILEDIKDPGYRKSERCCSVLYLRPEGSSSFSP